MYILLLFQRARGGVPVLPCQRNTLTTSTTALTQGSLPLIWGQWFGLDLAAAPGCGTSLSLLACQLSQVIISIVKQKLHDSIMSTKIATTKTFFRLEFIHFIISALLLFALRPSGATLLPSISFLTKGGRRLL